MWILQLLPDAVIPWFCNILLLTGIVLTVSGLFVQRLPLVYQYQLLFRVLGIALLVLGVYFKGGYVVEQEWRQRVTKLEAQLTTAKAESAQVNTVIQERVVTKTRVVKQKADTIIKRVEVLVPVDAACPVPQEAIDIHNEAAQMNQAIGAETKARK